MSGNCIRNVTSDPYAGATAEEIEDPRPTAELLRQWSTLHPEFAFLPRKFKIAVIASKTDRAVIKASAVVWAARRLLVKPYGPSFRVKNCSHISRPHCVSITAMVAAIINIKPVSKYSSQRLGLRNSRNKLKTIA